MNKEYAEEKEGAYRVAGSRVSLDSVVYLFRRGASPESIQRSFPSLTLEEVYGAVTFYLANQPEVDQYLLEGEREFEKLQRASRAAYPEWYEKLELARKKNLDSSVRRTRFQGDGNLNGNVITGILRQAPEIDFQTAREAGLHGLIDFQVLDLAADQERILVTQDQRTIPKHVEDPERLRGNLGILIISQKSDIKPVIEELILIWTAYESEEHVGSILYLDL